MINKTIVWQYEDKITNQRYESKIVGSHVDKGDALIHIEKTLNENKNLIFKGFV